MKREYCYNKGVMMVNVKKQVSSPKVVPEAMPVHQDRKKIIAIVGVTIVVLLLLVVFIGKRQFAGKAIATTPEALAVGSVGFPVAADSFMEVGAQEKFPLYASFDKNAYTFSVEVSYDTAVVKYEGVKDVQYKVLSDGKSGYLQSNGVFFHEKKGNGMVSLVGFRLDDPSDPSKPPQLLNTLADASGKALLLTLLFSPVSQESSKGAYIKVASNSFGGEGDTQFSLTSVDASFSVQPLQKQACDGKQIEGSEVCDGTNFKAGEGVCPEGMSGTVVCKDCNSVDVSGCGVKESCGTVGDEDNDGSSDCADSDCASDAACVGEAVCVVGAQNKDDCVIEFKDEELEKAVKKKLGVVADGKVRLKDVKSQKDFKFGFDTKEITDLSGLEFFTNVEILYLHHNDIITIDSLKYLTNLENLSLSFNYINDISTLSSLTDLQYLNLRYNGITDLSPLKNLVNLVELNVNNNPGLEGNCFPSQDWIKGKENVQAFLDKCLGSGSVDTDGDSVTDDVDSDDDNDGFSDEDEKAKGTNPLDAASKPTSAMVVKGDVECSGDVTNKDALLVKKFVLGEISAFVKSDQTLCETGLKAADVDCSAEITNKDALLIKKFVLGDIAGFTKSDGSPCTE